MDLQSQKTFSLLITKTISLNIPIDKIVYHSDLETTILVYFPSKSLNYTAINLILQKLSTLTIVKFTFSTRNDITLQTSVKQLRVITMCSAFTPECGYDVSLIVFIGDVFCPNTKCSGTLCLHKKTFQSPGRSDYQCPQCACVSRCTIFLLKIKQISFSCRLTKGFTFLERVPNQIKMLLELSIVLAFIVATERNANVLAVM